MTTHERLIETDRRSMGRQISLPLSKAFEIAWKGITIRLWRSMITMSGIILAIAFLTTVWTTSASVSALMKIPEGEKDRLLADAVLQKLAIATKNVSLRVGVLSAGLSSQQGKQESDAIRNILEPFSEFEPSVVPGYPDEFIRTCDRYDALVMTSLPADFARDDVLQKLREWVRGGGTLVVYGWGRLLPAGVPDSVKNTILSILPAEPTQDTLRVEGPQLSTEFHGVTQGVNWKTMPSRTYYLCKPRDQALGVAEAGDKPIVWVGEIGKGKVAFVPDTEPPDKGLFDWLSSQDLLGKCVRWGEAATLRHGSGSSRTTWLIVLSLLVCIVGITNAMLMSVTERFREIGTMKCLGALDMFIVKLFLIESTLMGAVGTILGILIGFILAYVRTVFSFNIEDPQTQKTVFLGLKYMPYGAVALRMLAALLVGIVLSVLAAIYPAYTAARMEPVEAMRVEE